jgi:hypothetical protein
MDRSTWRICRHGRTLVCETANNIEEPAQDPGSDRHDDRLSRAPDYFTPLQSGGRLERDGPHCLLVDMRLHLDDNRRTSFRLDQ